MNNKPELSVIVVANNEENKLSDCLKSANWAGELLVFDNNSTDKTAEIAQKYTKFIYKISKGNFSQRKNYAFSKARYPWILSLDADERVTPELKDEIITLISGVKSNNAGRSSGSIFDVGAYAIPRRNIILGREFKYSGQWPDYVVRLFRKDKFVAWKGELHEQPEIKGKLLYLKSPLLHQKHDNLSDMVEKTNQWSEVEAKLMFEAGHPQMNLVRFSSAIWREFYLRMIRQRSFLDGSEGTIYALYQIFSRFLSYAKLWEMQIAEKKCM
jgi:glycosyltransferase involved in cell wall biosynthesis